MGTFGGHALPGSFFVIFGIWWTIQIFNRYLLSQKRNTKFTSTAIYKCGCLCGRLKDWPVEAYLKIIFVGIGFSGEIYTGFSNGHFVHIGNGQHATMFFFFGLTGVVDVLLYHKVPLPPDMDYISLVMAIMCEFLLFKFHLHGRTDLDVLLHTLLIYAIAGSIIAIVLEMKYRNNILCALSRPFFTLLQGTWFWQVGWILYPPFENSFRWDEEDHHQMMIATMMFTWHAVVDLLIILGIGGLITFLHRKFGTYTEKNDMAMKRLISPGLNGDHHVVRLAEDSESDIEFEKSLDT